MKCLLFLVVTTAVLCTCSCIENKPAESKRQLQNIRTAENLQYSLVLPYSRVSSFRSIGPRKINHQSSYRSPRLPPYAVPMEPIVQYSQKDPLYDQKNENSDELFIKNDIHPQGKKINAHYDQDLSSENNQISENVYRAFYSGVPTPPFYTPRQRYFEEPEPIIEIIIKESNESLPAPPQPPPQSILKKDPVQVFYVKYAEDPHGSGKLIYEKPIPAVTPTSNLEEHHRETYVTVTPEPQYLPQPTTTIRTIIKPESETYHSESGVKVTFGTEGEHHPHHDEHNIHREDTVEGHEETAPEPSLAVPQQAQPRDSKVSLNDQKNHPQLKPQRPPIQYAQQRIQFQPQFLPNDQQLPRQQHSTPVFREPHRARQGPFGPASGTPGPQFQNIPFRGPPPNNAPLIYSKPPNGPPNFHSRPPTPHSPNFNNRPPSFHSGPSRPFHNQPQPTPIFNEPKYLQENYHTITTEHINPSKDSQPQGHLQPQIQNQPPQNFNFVPRPTGIPQSVPGPLGPVSRPNNFPDVHQSVENHGNRPIPNLQQSQQLPQQKPINYFDHTRHNNAPPLNKQHLVNNFNQRIPDNHANQPPQQPQHFSFHPIPPSHSQAQFKHNVEQTSLPPFQTLPPQNNVRQHSSPPQPLHSNPTPTFNTPQQNDQRGNFQNDFHRQNLGTVLPQGGELVASIPKYEQHIIVNSPSEQQQNYQLFNQQQTPSQAQPQQQNPTTNQEIRQQTQFYNDDDRKLQAQLAENVQKQQEEIRQQAQFYNHDQRKLQAELAENVQKQQEEIERLQAQLYQAQQQQRYQSQQQNANQQHSSKNIVQDRFVYPTQAPQSLERSKSHTIQQYSSSTSSPIYQTTLRTVKITPTTSKYSSSTLNTVEEETKKPEKKNKPKVELPDEVPDDLRQQLLSSGILDNADISILDYDKVGDTPLDSLPPDQLANFFNAGGAQQLAGSENKPIVVNKFGERINVKADDDLESDQEPSASENVPTFSAPPSEKKDDVEMKIVHFDPSTKTGQKIASDYMQEDATRIEPVNLNDKKYNRYLPLKVSGNQFPVPDILKGKKVTSVVVLAPVKSENLKTKDHSRLERATENKLKGISFIAGESLQKLLKHPTRENFEAWLNKEKATTTNDQSVVLLVTGNGNSDDEKEIFMYDIASKQVNKLSGDLSQAFVEAAETNSLAEDIEKIAISGDGIPEDLTPSKRDTEADINKTDSDEVDVETEASEDVPSYVDFSSMKINDNSKVKVSITSGYSKMKGG